MIYYRINHFLFGNPDLKFVFSDRENRLVVAKVKGGQGEGWIGSLKLTEVNYYIENA